MGTVQAAPLSQLPLGQTLLTKGIVSQDQLNIALTEQKRFKAPLGKVLVQLGFVTAVVPHAKLMEEARRWAGLILECSPMSVRATKQGVMRSLDAPSLEAAMNNMNYPAYAAMARGEDAIEGPKAFAEKRKPVWRGR